MREIAAGPAEACCADHATALPAGPERAAVRRRAWRLEVLTVGWNLVEGVVSVWAALVAGSVALLGFGLDSFVEMTSGGILLWRLHAEKEGMVACDVERIDQRAHRLVGASLLLLAAWVAFDASRALWVQERPEASFIGMGITSLSLVVMIWLARAKRRAAAALGSRALVADSFQTVACAWLSVATLSGLALNAALGWWWADPVAALALALLIAREGREAWLGRACCA